MNILVLDLINGYGGAEKYLLVICNYLQSHGVKIKLIVSDRRFFDELEESGLDAYIIPCPSLKNNLWRLPWYISQTVKNILSAIQGFQYQTILNNSERGLFFTGKFRRLNKNLNIIHFCHTTQMSRLVQNTFSRNINKVVCVSEHLKKSLPMCMQLKTKIIPNGFSLHKSTSAIRPITELPLIIGMACIVAPLKSLETALNSLLILSKKGIEIHLKLALIFASRGKYYDYIQELIEKMRHHYIIEVHENVKDTYEFFSKCHIVLTTSISKYGGPETFGRTIIEGWDAGCAVISSACGGPLEVIQDGINGLFFKEDDSVDLAEKITRLYQNKDLYESLCENGKKSSIEYSMDFVGEKIMSLISTSE